MIVSLCQVGNNPKDRVTVSRKMLITTALSVPKQFLQLRSSWLEEESSILIIIVCEPRFLISLSRTRVLFSMSTFMGRRMFL